MRRRHGNRARLGGVLLAALGALALLALPSVAAAKDRNHDRIPDRWEKRHHLSLTSTRRPRPGPRPPEQPRRVQGGRQPARPRQRRRRGHGRRRERRHDRLLRPGHRQADDHPRSAATRSPASSTTDPDQVRPRLPGHEAAATTPTPRPRATARTTPGPAAATLGRTPDRRPPRPPGQGDDENDDPPGHDGTPPGASEGPGHGAEQRRPTARPPRWSSARPSTRRSWSSATASRRSRRSSSSGTRRPSTPGRTT